VCAILQVLLGSFFKVVVGFRYCCRQLHHTDIIHIRGVDGVGLVLVPFEHGVAINQEEDQ